MIDRLVHKDVAAERQRAEARPDEQVPAQERRAHDVRPWLRGGGAVEQPGSAAGSMATSSRRSSPAMRGGRAQTTTRPARRPRSTHHGGGHRRVRSPARAAPAPTPRRSARPASAAAAERAPARRRTRVAPAPTPPPSRRRRQSASAAPHASRACAVTLRVQQREDRHRDLIVSEGETLDRVSPACSGVVLHLVLGLDRVVAVTAVPLETELRQVDLLVRRLPDPRRRIPAPC